MTQKKEKNVLGFAAALVLAVLMFGIFGIAGGTANGFSPEMPSIGIGEASPARLATMYAGAMQSILTLDRYDLVNMEIPPYGLSGLKPHYESVNGRQWVGNYLYLWRHDGKGVVGIAIGYLKEYSDDKMAVFCFTSDWGEKRVLLTDVNLSLSYIIQVEKINSSFQQCSVKEIGGAERFASTIYNEDLSKGILLEQGIFFSYPTFEDNMKPSYVSMVKVSPSWSDDILPWDESVSTFTFSSDDRLRVYWDKKYYQWHWELMSIPLPTVTTDNATNIQSGQATLNGNLIGLGGTSSADVWFELGTTDSYGSTTPKQTKTAVGAFESVLTGLSSNTLYHFRAAAQNKGGVSYGEDMNFTTTEVPGIIWQDNMENGVNGWNATGLWRQGTERFNSPNTSWVYNKGPPDYNYDTGQPNSGSLISPQINLSQYKSAMLNFSYWYRTEYDGPSWDQRWVRILSDGKVIQSVQLAYDGMEQWHKYTLDVSKSAAGKNIAIEFHFDTLDALYNNYEGWYIDDVKVLGEPIEKTNNPPVAYDQQVLLPEDTPTEIVLNAADENNDPLVYTIVTQPVNGVLSGTAPDVIYMSNSNYYGPDNFTFKVNDGKADSNVALIDIKVFAVNDPPVAYNQTISVLQDVPMNFTLNASDPDPTDWWKLEVQVVNLPSHGKVEWQQGFNVLYATYIPDEGYYGTDNFTYVVSDGYGGYVSNPAIVDINIKQKVWDADWKYLKPSSPQARKFCLGVSGTYGAQRVYIPFGRFLTYQYVDPADNSNFAVKTAAYSRLPVSAVRCLNGQVYPTNKDYWLAGN